MKAILLAGLLALAVTPALAHSGLDTHIAPRRAREGT